MGTVRSPRTEVIVTAASSATSAEMVSLAGLAVTMLPTTVARLRSGGEPTSRHAWASGRPAVRIGAEAMTSAWVTSGPSVTRPPS